MLTAIRQRVRSYLANRLHVPSIESSLQRLARSGYTPEGVYDVGAYHGEFAEIALKVWPKTRVTCFEPQETCAPELDRVVKRYRGQVAYEKCLLGAEFHQGMTFHLGDTASSVLAHSADDQYPTTVLPMTTIDDCRRKPGSKPCGLLKLDVQGYELNVLKGAQETLDSEIDAVLAEVNFLDIYRDVPLVDQTLGWLAHRGFVAFDISSLIRRPLDDALWQADVIFVRANGAFRSDKRWVAA